VTEESVYSAVVNRIVAEKKYCM